ncbi:unnamed protein product [Rhizoctonia solani]|uniref:CHAT domain-containing protein n=1 Tax=Rhizoctonia solani TaxID=456999 RepID=A0A8H2X5C8_9AGAM|nr:unnamed protein product [Rhizoctonia solani]
MNLGCSWSRQFALLQLPTDIEKAIKYQAQATQLIPDGHADKQMYLNILGNSWAHRFRVFGDEGDLDKAIQLQVQVVELTPEGHPDRPRNLSNLKNLLAYRHQQFSDPYDFKSGNCIASDGYGAQPHNSNPGHAYIDRSELFDLLEDPESKLVSSQSHAQVIIADPETQIECTLKWAACSVQLGLSPFNACQKLFKLIPRLTWVGVAIQRRYSILIKIGDLVAQAAAWAISVGYYDLAIEWLEKGRSVVWKQLLQLRTPFEDLTAFDPRLSNHLKSISAELEGVGPRKTATAPDSTELPRDFENQESHQLDLAAQWELLLAEARQLPGLDDFLQPQNVQELKKAASDGPLVIINTHPSRCDALIIFPGHEDVMHVPLDRFSHAEAIECRTRMVALIGHRGTDEKRRGFKCYNGVPQDPLRPLSVLWSNVVAPILEALAITHKQPYDELPHIKWCATGALSFLPLHAAGLYDGKSPNAFDLIVSSYTPTLSALLPRNNNTHEPHTGILAVGQASSPGFPPLPKTVEELAIIRKHAGSIPFQQLDGPLATVEATRKAIQNHSWVHIACHASQNRADPSQSAFHLHDGELTLETIAKRGLKNKGLAFLSACQTATGDDELPDEATHLAAGMLMAGFPSVIATLWSIMDEDAPGIAEDVYAELMHDGKMDHTKSARALHKAVGELRKKVGPECIGRWAPFVHIGV